MKDPLGIMGAETIFVMEYHGGRNVLEEFENMDIFKAGVARGPGGVWFVPLLQQVTLNIFQN